MLCAFLLIIYFWGDRIILAIVKAQKLPRTQIDDHESYKSEIENIACLMGLTQIKIYRAKTLPSNIYLLKGIHNSSCIIIGGDPFEHLSEQEIQVLIYFSILKIKRLNLRFIQGCNFFFFIVNLPAMLLKNFKPLNIINLMIVFFLLPLQAFKQFTFKENNQHSKVFIKRLEMDTTENFVQAVLFKLKHLSSEYSRDIHQLLLADLTIVEKRNYE